MERFSMAINEATRLLQGLATDAERRHLALASEPRDLPCSDFVMVINGVSIKGSFSVNSQNKLVLRVINKKGEAAFFETKILFDKTSLLVTIAIAKKAITSQLANRDPNLLNFLRSNGFAVGSIDKTVPTKPLKVQERKPSPQARVSVRAQLTTPVGKGPSGAEVRVNNVVYKGAFVAVSYAGTITSFTVGSAFPTETNVSGLRIDNEVSATATFGKSVNLNYTVRLTTTLKIDSLSLSAGAGVSANYNFQSFSATPVWRAEAAIQFDPKTSLVARYNGQFGNPSGSTVSFGLTRTF
jgi:hypothetical protein